MVFIGSLFLEFISFIMVDFWRLEFNLIFRKMCEQKYALHFHFRFSDAKFRSLIVPREITKSERGQRSREKGEMVT